VRADHARLEREFALAEAIGDRAPRLVRDAELDRRRARPAEHLHAVVAAGAGAPRERNADLGGVAVEHVLAVLRRTLPAVEQSARELVCAELG